MKVYQKSQYANGSAKYRFNSASLFVGDIERARHGDFSEDPKFKVQYDQGISSYSRIRYWILKFSEMVHLFAAAGAETGAVY